MLDKKSSKALREFDLRFAVKKQKPRSKPSLALLLFFLGITCQSLSTRFSLLEQQTTVTSTSESSSIQA